jgi:hypothetical protein
MLTNLGNDPVVPTFSAADHATGVHGLARLQATPAGTRIMLTVKGVPADERCRLVAVSHRGREVAASWSAGYDGTARIIGTSAIRKYNLTALQVESPGHKLLLIIRMVRHRRG